MQVGNALPSRQWGEGIESVAQALGIDDEISDEGKNKPRLHHRMVTYENVTKTDVNKCYAALAREGKQHGPDEEDEAILCMNPHTESHLRDFTA